MVISNTYALASNDLANLDLSVHDRSNGAPMNACIVEIAGELFFPPGDSDRNIQTSQFMMVAEPAFADQLHLGAAFGNTCECY